MHLKLLFAAMPAVLLVLGSAVANAQTINEAGALACVNDKWDVKEPEKGHKLVDYAGRCVSVPDDPGEPKYTMERVGKYEYMPDGSWKGAGTCTDTFKSGDTKIESWEEGSHLKEYPDKYTGGTGKYEGATGGGTYTMDWEEAAGFVKAMQPRMAIPMHYGFVVCSPSHAGRFRKGAQPVPVEILEPTNPFEQP